MKKNELRKLYLQKRMALSEAEFLELNRKVVEQFFAGIDLSFIKVVHTFLPIEKQREVNTWLIIERIRREFPNIRLSVPRVNNQTASIDSFYYEGIHQLEKNTWDILEPKQGVPTPVEKIDAMLIPLLTVDKHGNRVGYGRGFYDKFLDSCPDTIQRIGLSLFPVVDRVDDVSSYDIPLHWVVTPDEVLKLS